MYLHNVRAENASRSNADESHRGVYVNARRCFLMLEETNAISASSESCSAQK